MTNKGVAFGGAAILVVGLFTPIVTLPFLGSVNLFNNGTNIVALALLALAALAAGLALKDRDGDIIWPGVAAAGILVYYFVRLQFTLSQMRSSMAKSLDGNPFAAVAQTAMSSVQLQWGWILLALGAGLLVYSGLQVRKATSQRVFSLGERPGPAIAVVAVLLLVVAIGWDWFGAATSKTAVDASASTATAPSVSSTASDATSNKPSQEEAAYITQHLRLYDFEAKYYDSYDGRTPGVDFKIKNQGNRTLNRVTVLVVFQDSEGKPIAEEEYNPVIVSEYSLSGDNKPLRPNYIWQNEPDKFYTAKSVPSEWKEGKATATITDIEFGPNG